MVNLKIPPEHSSFRDKKWMEAIAGQLGRLIVDQFGFVENTTLDTVASTTAADLTGMSITVTVETGDLVFLIGNAAFSVSTMVDGAYHNFTDGTTAYANTSLLIVPPTAGTTGRLQSKTIFALVSSPAIGSVTYKMQHRRSGGSATVYTREKQMSVIVFRQS